MKEFELSEKIYNKEIKVGVSDFGDDQHSRMEFCHIDDIKEFIKRLLNTKSRGNEIIGLNTEVVSKEEIRKLAGEKLNG